MRCSIGVTSHHEIGDGRHNPYGVISTKLTSRFILPEERWQGELLRFKWIRGCQLDGSRVRDNHDILLLK